MYGAPVNHISNPSSNGLFGFESYYKSALEEASGSLTWNHLPSISDASKMNDTGFFSGSMNSPPAEARSILEFQNGFDQWASSGSVLSFEQGERVSNDPKIGHEDYSIWADSMDHTIEWNHLKSKIGIDSRLIDDANCYQTATRNGSTDHANNDNRHGEKRFSWLYSGAMDIPQDLGGLEGCFHKSPNMGGEMQVSKKHCVGTTKKHKPIPSKDSQSFAAKNRRERISERLRILQDLVPNGTKVDLVTMLEKAISYVKFLQLQVKVLATDEFWPAQNGKAPEVGEVKEAINAILSSHNSRDLSFK